ncbi:MAG TPA: glycosyl hydrolase family 8 [Solirubrobacteraceae bacterium]|nr:glycosyl hydrolase family 8 [Solirubrobacteraceae bacterium]
MTVAAVLIAIAAVATFELDTSSDGHSATTASLTAAKAFLRTYVKHDGRVTRPGNDDDTVSEGQSYGLLLAEVAHRPATFAQIWRWTASHLQQPDGLLAWHANSSGAVLSKTPATDADVLTAWALSRASGPGSSEYHAQARRMASAILANETIKKGPLLLAAGPWGTGSPGSLDPSYWSPLAFDGLAKFTGDSRWTALARSSSVYIRALTANGSLLPPDWARLDGNNATAEPAPNGSVPQTQYGLDAQRVVLWMASSCAASDRKLAAKWWPLLSPKGRAAAIALGTKGNVIDTSSNALTYVAAAAAARAAGDDDAMNGLLAKARAAQAQAPNYYGGAWVALGEALLTTKALGSCAGQE